MRVIKPQALGILARPFEYKRRILCGFSILAFAPMDGRRTLLSEISLWKTVAECLGSEGMIDAGIPKRGSEFLLSGSAWAREEDQRKMRVSARLGDRQKELNVFGDRFFDGDLISEPEPFQSMELNWANAFGGEGFSQNPVGKGAIPIIGSDGKKRYPLPNIEYPHDLLVRVGQRTRPAGFGSLDPMWPQRQAKVGTYDQTWLKTDYPGLAKDIDWAFFNLASPDQHFDQALAGNESYSLEGFHPERERIDGSLPAIRARCFIRRQGQSELEELVSQLTTVWFFPEKERLAMVFHASAECAQPDASDIEIVMVGADLFEHARESTFYQSVLERQVQKKPNPLDLLSDEELMPEGLDPSDTWDFESILKSDRKNVRADNLINRIDRELENARKAIAERTPKPDDESLQAKAIKAVEISELKDPRGMNKQELRELFVEMKASNDKMREEAEAKREQALKKLHDGMLKLKEKFPNEDIPTVMEKVGPPKFSAEKREAKIREGIESMSARGIDVATLKEKLLSPEMLVMLKEGERSLIRGYRRLAHQQQAAPFSDSDGSRGRELLEMVKSGQSLDAQDFTGVDLSGVDLSGANLEGVFLESANLEGANLSGAKLDKAVLSNARLADAILDNASLNQANLGKADLANCRARQCQLNQAILVEANLGGCVLDQSSLKRADLAQVLFQYTSLSGVKAAGLLFMEVDLKGLDFSFADLTGAVFMEAEIDGCNFSGACMDAAIFLKSRARSARFEGTQLFNFRVIECDLSGSDFTRAQMSEANLRDNRLVACKFDESNLEKSDFSLSQLGQSSLRRCVARHARFISSDFREADLSGGNFMNASFERADLRLASLKGGNLYAVDLARAHVDKNTDFSEALTHKMRTYPRRFPKGA